MSSAIMMYALICLFFFAAYFVLNQSFLPQSEFLDMIYITSTVISSIAWLLVVFVIDTGKPAAKTVFYAMSALQGAFSFWLLYKVYSDPAAWIVWLIWAILMLIETYFLFRFGRWMFTSYYGKIFFDKTLVVYEDSDMNERPVSNPGRVSNSYSYNQPDRQSEKSQREFQSPNAASVRVPDFSSPDARYQAEYDYGPKENSQSQSRVRNRLAKHPWLAGIFMLDHEPLTYPKAAVRLGVIVYGEMVLFPILTEVCSILFKSANGKFTFATSIMFTLCIISAVIWTIPMFFLYLKQTGVKALIVIGIGIEVIVGISYFYVLRGYYIHPLEDHVYRLSVFLWFALFDGIRLLILLWAILPILKIPRPTPEEVQNQFGEMKLFSNTSLPKVKIPDPKSLIDRVLDLKTAEDEYDDEYDIEFNDLEDEELENKNISEYINKVNETADDETHVRLQDKSTRSTQFSKNSKTNQSEIYSEDSLDLSIPTFTKKRNHGHPTHSDLAYESNDSLKDQSNDPLIFLPGDDGFDKLS
ncbi:hypothetical protein [Ileibacterium valens]|uniref:hypothetical protein n=1 Tax=Ileibacterium valens TaxID=1862668 RepID=UPI00272B3E3A|nr:hypothetical protein [Ileibacterium valens]